MSKNNKTPSVGSIRIWWVPQVGMKSWFSAEVPSIEEGVRLLDTLAKYDIFQLENKIKPDFCNAGGLQHWVADTGEGSPGWVDWSDEESGEDDPRRYLEEKAGQSE
jgi:hypothetical protein